jgi:hypothetical protein
MQAFVLVLRSSRRSASCRTRRTLGEPGPDLLLVFIVEWTSGMSGKRLLLGFKRYWPRRWSYVRYDWATRFDNACRRHNCRTATTGAKHAVPFRSYRRRHCNRHALQLSGTNLNGIATYRLRTDHGALRHGHHGAGHSLVYIMDILHVGDVRDPRIVVVIVVGNYRDVGDARVAHIHVLEIRAACTIWRDIGFAIT